MMPFDSEDRVTHFSMAFKHDGQVNSRNGTYISRCLFNIPIQRQRKNLPPSVINQIITTLVENILRIPHGCAGQGKNLSSEHHHLLLREMLKDKQ